MLKPTILKALRKATDVAIKTDPTTISLQPAKEQVKVGGGIYKSVDVSPRLPQTFLVSSVGATTSGITGTSGGQVNTDGASGHSWSYTITGRHDAEMEIGDSWKEGVTLYSIISLQPFNGYEKVGVVTAYGPDPSYG